MKRTFRFLPPVLALAVSFSCQTYDRSALQAVGSLAVVSVQCVRTVDTEAFDDFAPVARGWVKSEEFDLAPAAARIVSSVFSSYARSFPFTLVPERQVLDAPAYQALGTDGTKLLGERTVTMPPGYLALPVTAASARVLAERFPEVDAFLWAEVTYALVNKGEFKGTRFARMEAVLTLTVFDRAGRAILRHTESAEDTVELKIITIGIMPPAEFAQAALRATAQAGSDMARWLETRAARP